MAYDLTASPPAPPLRLHANAIAPWSHTVGLIAFLALYATLGHMRAAGPAVAGSHVLRYVSSVTLEWLLLGSVIAGIYHRREFFTNALGDRQRSTGYALALGVAVYCIGLMLIASIGMMLYFTPLIHKMNEAVVLAMLPHGLPEFGMWLVLSLTAGVCEEVIFRGYLQQQIMALTQRPGLSIVIVGVLFGCLHVYEGAAAIVPLAALGMLFGVVVRRCGGDLRAVIVAHTLQDFLVALLALARPLAESHGVHS